MAAGTTGADDRGLLRVLACGSVDDGKSSLLGRLLHELDAIPDDQRRTLEADSRRVGTRGGAVDYALLFDGLAAEREQGITIDVAWRQFATLRRRFIVADAPGHEQYTRNMATGAAAADVAILLVDARKGLLPQTWRHARIAALFGVQRVVLAVNKMDLVDWSEGVFGQIVEAFHDAALRMGFVEAAAIPMSAVEGEGVAVRGLRMPWYRGPCLLEWLEGVALPLADAQDGACLPIQYVIRPDADFRGYAGRLARGRLRPGDRLRVQRSGSETRVSRLVALDGDVSEAIAGQSVMVVTDSEVDIGRGDLLVGAETPLEMADQFEATLVWVDDEPLLPGRQYDFKLGPQRARASVNPLKYRIDPGSDERLATERLELNDIGVGELSLDRLVACHLACENEARILHPPDVIAKARRKPITLIELGEPRLKVLLWVRLPAELLRQKTHRVGLDVWHVVQRSHDTDLPHIRQIDLVPQDARERVVTQRSPAILTVDIAELARVGLVIHPLDRVPHALGRVVRARENVSDVVLLREVVHRREEGMVLRRIDMGDSRPEEGHLEILHLLPINHLGKEVEP